MIYQPLKTPWRLDEFQGNVQEQIRDRVNSEDNFCWALGYPIIKSKEVTGRWGEPLPEVK